MNWKELTRKQLGDHADTLNIKLDKRANLKNMQEQFEKQLNTENFITPEEDTASKNALKKLGQSAKDFKETGEIFKGFDFGESESQTVEDLIEFKEEMFPNQETERRLMDMRIGDTFEHNGRCRLDKLQGVKAYWYNLDEKKNYTGSAYKIV